MCCVGLVGMNGLCVVVNGIAMETEGKILIGVDVCECMCGLGSMEGKELGWDCVR